MSLRATPVHEEAFARLFMHSILLPMSSSVQSEKKSSWKDSLLCVGHPCASRNDLLRSGPSPLKQIEWGGTCSKSRNVQSLRKRKKSPDSCSRNRLTDPEASRRNNRRRKEHKRCVRRGMLGTMTGKTARRKNLQKKYRRLEQGVHSTAGNESNVRRFHNGKKAAERDERENRRKDRSIVEILFFLRKKTTLSATVSATPTLLMFN